MSQIESEGLLKKVRSLGRELGKSTFLVSKPQESSTYHLSFKASAQYTRGRYQKLTREVSRQKHVTHEIESIFDSFFVVGAAIFEIQNNVRRDDVRRLPFVAIADGSNVPRLYHILSKLMEATRYLVDKETITEFLIAYQEQSPLSTRELYVVPLVFQILLVEQFGRLVEKAIVSLDEYGKARHISSRIMKEVRGRKAPDFSRIISGLATSYGIIPLSLGFYLFQRLSPEASSVRPVLKWLKLNLEKQGIDSRNLADIEGRERATNSTLASHVIESFHWINQTRWEQVAEDVNIVDTILSKDPAGAYAFMETESKALYRRAIVHMAEVAGIHEAEIARAAVRLAQQSDVKSRKSSVAKVDVSPAEAHVGFYLVDDGVHELRHRIGYKYTTHDRVVAVIKRHSSRFYFGLVAVLDVLCVACTLYVFWGMFPGVIALSIFSVIATLFNIEVSLALVNALVVKFMPVSRLPELDISRGVSESQRTFVVIPTMIRSIESIRETVRKLEIRFLGNDQDNILYALLFDFMDASSETLPGDDVLIREALAGMDDLNARYGGREKRFYALYRKRLWNESEGVFMGWERKRGKLREFNMLLRGVSGTSYVNGEILSSVSRVRYVITLDEDTEMPKDAARRLIGCIHHPINRPVISREGNSVIRGYGIIQPRVGVRLAVADTSSYSRLYSGGSGIDSYSIAVSDVYQDFFGSALFFGKGIYDIDAVESTMKSQIPDNLVLSHDLLEGIYARTGYASSIVFFDGFPRFYHEFAVRLHRWIRGDWQIVGWLFGTRKPLSPDVAPRPLSFVDRFKIFDNLRRSLVPVMGLAILVLAIPFPKASVLAALYVLLVLAAPSLVSLMSDTLSVKRISLPVRSKDFLNQAWVAVAHIVLRAVFVVHHAFISISAIGITLVRLVMTRRHLLEWQTSSDVGFKFRGMIREFYRVMIMTQVLPVAYFAFVYVVGSVNLVLLACSASSMFSPCVAFLISRAKSRSRDQILDRQAVSELRATAYRTARYFIDLPRVESNWLIQDHLQLRPSVTREDCLTTSPTNLGMLFGSLFSAQELGYLTMDRFIDRSRKALESIFRLERYKGHLYNWYDIQTLEPLSPRYVSSVDSANFILALIAFRQGVLRLPSVPLLRPSSVDGFWDAVRVLSEEVDALARRGVDGRPAKSLLRDLMMGIERIRGISRSSSELLSLSDFYRFFTEIHPLVVDLEKTASSLRADESMRVAEQVCSLVEIIARDIEAQLSLQRYLFSYVRLHDASVDAYVSKDAHLSGAYRGLLETLNQIPSFDRLAHQLPDAVEQVGFSRLVHESSLSGPAREYVIAWYDGMLKGLRRSAVRASSFLADIDGIQRQCATLIDEPDFGFLYNKERGLFHIGHNATYDKIDSNCYNFLASESNSVSFVAVLKNQVPQKHWFYLGRKLVRTGGIISLVSWGGSLFEYLTSLIYFNTHENSLLGKTARAAISVHRRHGALSRTPWGMGESAYYLFDASKHYQYQIFGSAHLGLKRGLADYLVIAPYVSALSLSFVPRAAIKNLRRISKIGGKGQYGFFDAIDYMDSGVRLSAPVPIQIWYAHHQGFTLLGIHNAIDPNRIRNLFHSDARVASLDLLLEEKMPATPTATALSVAARLPFTASQGISEDGSESRRYVPARSAYPHLALLGNGSYSVSVSNSGGGYSKYGDVALTRYRDDQILEESGSFFYIKNMRTGALWSSNLKPLGGDSRRHKIVFHENKAEFEVSHGSISARLGITTHPDYPAEIRSLELTNEGSVEESLLVASYGEVSLALQVQETHHPLFQRLMVKSWFVEDVGALVYSRPHPADRTKKIYFAHMLTGSSSKKHRPVPCADRETFFGHLGGIKNPAFLDKNQSTQPVRPYTLDPIFSLSRSISLKPHHSVRLVFVNVAHESYDELLKILRKLKGGRGAVTELARALVTSAEKTKSLGITQEMGGAFQALASRVLGGRTYGMSSVPASDLPYVHSLWKIGVSGDYPLVVLVIKDIEDIQTVKQALLCHVYWKHKGLDIDMIILNQEPSSYIKSLDDEIDFLLRQSASARVDASGSKVYHLKSDLMEPADKAVLLHVARVVIDSKDGSFKQQAAMVGKTPRQTSYPAKLIPSLSRSQSYSLKRSDIPPSGLEFDNSWGGFDVARSEYVIRVLPQSQPPAPWSNIIASPSFGTAVDHRGSMFTWSVDSHDNRLTAWNNDPLSFKSSEIFYIRDEETGETWNPTPFPIRSPHPFVVRHGKGYTTFEHSRGDLSFSFKISVSLDSTVKMVRLVVKNRGNRGRKLSETAFLEPVLGSVREHSRDFMLFERDGETGALMFGNGYKNHLAKRVAFVDLSSGAFDVSTDKAEFIGRHGSYEAPTALKRAGLSNVLTSGSSNCIVTQTVFSVAPGEESEIVFLLGEAESRQAAREMILAHRNVTRLGASEARVSEYWKDLSDSVRIETPDKSLDVLFNDQLLHQSLSSRVWGKTGMHQPSGAFGFRDQLQDMSAFVWSRPRDVRAFILNAAAHQFRDGDALNWWHEYNGFGVRSVLSDHQLWLVYATLEYVSVTGDNGILDEEVSFLEGPQLSFAYQSEWAGTPKASEEVASLYEHCVRAISRSSVFGTHGLPLIGRSDWNDGLSKVGAQGKGESVWVAWFLGYLMDRLAVIAKKRGDVERADSYGARIVAISKSIDRYAWDGKWYRRAFLDSGTALGSKKLREFKIDSVAQSWASLSGMARMDKRDRALRSMLEKLCVSSTMRLLAPALSDSALDPGYIKDYPPGVRENGSQYNHAALWAAQALFLAGQADEGKKVLDLVNPFLRSDSAEKASRYRVEPYVLASDVYAEPSYEGRGGWTWYTGSAGVMYKTVLQFMLGFHVEGDSLSFEPALPSEWGSCVITYRYGKTVYEITYEKSAGSKSVVRSVSENGAELLEGRVSLADDGVRHIVRVVLV
ncbi:MAG: glucoamylase family protein [Candidatus Paceibacterota bacterium]|jgi:cyclic beta-1,2-glucan synthetase